MKEKTRNAAGALIIAASALYCLAEPGQTRAAVSAALGRCLDTLIPSLFAMMAAAYLLTESGFLRAASRLPGWMTLPGRLLFGFESSMIPVFTFSMFAGYPVGMKLISAEYSAGRLSCRRASLLAGLCFGAGPAFVYGCISAQLYGSSAAGRLIMISAAGGNVLLALLLSPVTRRLRPEENTAPVHTCYEPALLTEAVSSAGRSMAQLCFTVLAFAVITAMLGSLGFTGAVSDMLTALSGRPHRETAALTAAFLDITAAGSLTHGDHTLLPAVTALVSFGGVCVFFQLGAVSGGEIPLLPVVLMRAAAAALSYFICRALLPFLMAGETVTVSVAGAVHRADSVVPSVMLILMSVMVMREWGAGKLGIRNSGCGIMTSPEGDDLGF